MQGWGKGEKQFLSRLTIYEQGIADVTRHQDVVFHYDLVWLQKNREFKSEKTGEVRNKKKLDQIHHLFLPFPPEATLYQ